jgi:GNAT superfamily N-acetyltransferase
VDTSEARHRPPHADSCTIRPAAEADAAAVADLHVRAWRWAYRDLLPDAYLDGLGQQRVQREAMWRRLLQRGGPDRPLWVAERGGRLVGFCNTAPTPGEPPDTAELQTLYLEPDVVGTGGGAALVRHALADLRARGVRTALLWVLDTNAQARRFYERGGWRADGSARTEEVWGVTVSEVRYRLALDSPVGRPDSDIGPT